MKAYSYWLLCVLVWSVSGFGAAVAALNPQDIYYEVHGQQNPNTIVFVHGLDSTANTFSVIAGVLSQNFRVVVYDQRGHGRTAPVGLDYSPDVLADDLEALRQRLGIERFAIYGHSLGARTALAYATKYPERVSAFIAEEMEFFARFNPTPAKMNQILQRGALIQKRITQYHYRSMDELKKTLAPLYFGDERALSRVVTQRTQANPDGSVDLLIHPFVSWLYGYQANAVDFSESLRILKVPFLALKAVNSSGSALSDEGVKHILRNKPDAHIEAIAGASHLIHLTHPRAVVELVEVFLANGRVPISARGKYAPKQDRNIASVLPWENSRRQGPPPLAIDAPPMLQKKFPRISAVGVDLFKENLVERGMLPRGTALLTGAGALVQSGIGGIVHLALATRQLGAGGIEPHLKSVEAALKNGFRLAAAGGVKRVAIPFVGAGRTLDRMGISSEELAETLVRTCLGNRLDIEVAFVLWTAGDVSLFREVLQKLSATQNVSGIQVYQGSIADGRLHGAPLVFSPGYLDFKFGGGLSALIGRATKQPKLVEAEAAKTIASFNQALGPFLR